jgi:ketopantoate hydroxymethyltransferase
MSAPDVMKQQILDKTVQAAVIMAVHLGYTPQQFAAFVETRWANELRTK